MLFQLMLIDLFIIYNINIYYNNINFNDHISLTLVDPGKIFYFVILNLSSLICEKVFGFIVSNFYSKQFLVIKLYLNL